MKYLIIFFSIFFLLAGNSAYAVGIGVKPKSLDLNVSLGKEVKTELLIINVSEEPAIYQLYPDSFKKEIKIIPSDFTLEPSANQLVQVSVKMKRPGLFRSNISAVARPLGSGGFSAGSGVKIPITINSSGIVIFSAAIGIILACLILIFAVLLIKKRKNSKLKNDEIIG